MKRVLKIVGLIIVLLVLGSRGHRGERVHWKTTYHGWA